MRYNFILVLSISLQCLNHFSFGQKLNETQVIGSHNSYKSAMPSEVLEYLRKINPTAAQSLEYVHLPLSEQLDLGLRNLELDVFHDPMGGKYTNPKSVSLLAEGAVFDAKKRAARTRIKAFSCAGY
ncbi:Ca2+-dependent phosphoinositide-specific phospholipase C [Algoriphagus boritolerans]|uniref:Ca2+-dependent phosphoinositide-specific phospholipase C n=1 Tax=Algoriphagus boritolerans TaxID=308111 RepID=UPI000A976B18